MELKKIELNKYGPIISSETVGEDIYKIVKEEIDKGASVELNLLGIKTMATFCAKQIFGRLYIELGAEMFYEKISIKNADNDLKTIISIGIKNALDDKEKN